MADQRSNLERVLAACAEIVAVVGPSTPHQWGLEKIDGEYPSSALFKAASDFADAACPCHRCVNERGSN